jgi:hypothetical protein
VPATRAPHPGEHIIFLSFPDAAAGTVQGRKLKRDYVLACRFLHCTIMDRTEALDQGFAYAAIDPIPRHVTSPHSFAELCDTIGGEIVNEALQADKTIAVLWSGGIDSTSALIAVMKAAIASGCTNRIHVCLSLDSVSEYPGFFLNHICGRLRIQSITRPMSAFLDSTVLNVTGEHGDQLFGSQLLRPYVQRGFGQVNYEDVLGAIMLERLGNPWSALRVRRYLDPVIEAAPVPIRTVFDYLWWLNYALKWQSVTLRLAVSRGDQTYPVYRSLRHFFRDERFQRWALANTPGRAPSEWPRYKDVAKQYTLEFTGDVSYFTHKEKQDSLRNVLLEPKELTNHLVFMREDFRPHSTLTNGSAPAPTSFWNKEPRSHATILQR